jgi:hypothetical protein
MDSIFSAMDAKTWIDSIFKIVAAIWAIVLLVHLRQRDKVNADFAKTNADAAKARAEIDKARADMESKRAELDIAHIRLQIELDKNRRDIVSGELADAEIELRIRRQVSVSVDIEVNEDKISVERPVFVVVRLTNHGNEATVLKWEGEPPPFTVRFVSFSASGDPQYEAPRSFQVRTTKEPTQLAKSHVVRAQSTETLAFAFQPDKEGVYLLSFRAATAEKVRDEAKKHGVLLPTAWTAKRYVYVPKTIVVSGSG